MNVSPSHNQEGFTLLETIVALVLLATVGMALFTWINSGLDSLHRLEDFDQRSRSQKMAAEYIKTINPMLKPEGESGLGPYRISWQARPVGKIYPGKNRNGMPSSFIVGLYEVYVEVWWSQGQGGRGDTTTPLSTFSLLKAGYKYK